MFDILDLVNYTEYHRLNEAEWSLLEAYDCGEYEYSDAYRHCSRVARALAYGWQ